MFLHDLSLLLLLSPPLLSSQSVNEVLVGAKESVKGPCEGSGKELSSFSTQRQAKREWFKLLPAGFRFGMRKISECDEPLECITKGDDGIHF